MRLEFRYDHVGRRIEKNVFHWDEGDGRYRFNKSVNFVYDGWNLIAEARDRGEVSSMKTYLWGLDLSYTPQGAGGVGGLLAVRSENGGTQLPFYDGNGNVVGLASAQTGELTAHYTYGSFGELLQATGPAAADYALRFSTKYCDAESNLTYYGYRYYDSETGRWSNRDPLDEKGGVNLRSYVFNQPQDRFDPDGRVASVIGVKICVGAGSLTPAGWIIVGGCCVAGAAGYVIGRIITKDDVEDTPEDPPRFSCKFIRSFFHDYAKVCVYECPNGTERYVDVGMNDECVDVKDFDKEE